MTPRWVREEKRHAWISGFLWGTMMGVMLAISVCATAAKSYGWFL